MCCNCSYTTHVTTGRRLQEKPVCRPLVAKNWPCETKLSLTSRLLQLCQSPVNFLALHLQRNTGISFYYNKKKNWLQDFFFLPVAIRHLSYEISVSSSSFTLFPLTSICTTCVTRIGHDNRQHTQTVFLLQIYELWDLFAGENSHSSIFCTV